MMYVSGATRVHVVHTFYVVVLALYVMIMNKSAV